MPELQRCLTPRELARRWRCRPSKIRAMVLSGLLAGIEIGGRTRILPESVRAAEEGALTVRRPGPRRRREPIPREIAEILGER